jgi:hypothetical protein
MAEGLRALRARVAFDGVTFVPEGVTVLVEGDLIVGVERCGSPLPTECPVTDVLRAVVESAHLLGLAVLAHAHSLSGIRHALDAGVDGEAA